jgi:hypothetical protein
MKKGIFLAIALLFGLASVALAQAPNVGNTNQQGSVLIFPKIVTYGSADTVISISNGNSNTAVEVECVWVNPSTKPPFPDFSFQLTANQTVAFDARYGYDSQTYNGFPCGTNGGYGELKCWAVDAATANQINFNYLTGSAKVLDFSKYTAYEYNAWIFKALAGTTNAVIGTPGIITLDGVNYEACPQYFLGNFFATGADYDFVTGTDLTLVPCKQDLREERTATQTKAQFTIWNTDEVLNSGAVQCITDWYEGSLGTISNLFDSGSFCNSAARFAVRGIPNTTQSVCGFVGVYTPFVGLIVEDLNFHFGSDSTGEVLPALTASTGFGSGIDTSGFIYWDPSSVMPSVSHKK